MTLLEKIQNFGGNMPVQHHVLRCRTLGIAVAITILHAFLDLHQHGIAGGFFRRHPFGFGQNRIDHRRQDMEDAKRRIKATGQIN